MSKIVMLFPPFHGHMNPAILLAEELVNRGETVIFFTTELFRGKVEAIGATFKSCWFWERKINTKYKNTIKLNDFSLENWAKRINSDLIINGKITRYLLKMVDAAHPDCIIHDNYAHFGKQLSVLLGIPAITLFTTFAYSQEMFNNHPEYVISNIFKLSSKYLSDPELTRTQLKRISEEGAEKHGIITEDCHFGIDRCFSIEKTNIVLTTRNFQIMPESCNTGYHFVGYPLLRSKPYTVNNVSSGKSTHSILISLGTTDDLPNRIGFYKRCFEAFDGMDIKVILSVGNTDIRDLGEIPGNFVVRNHIPQIDVLENASLYITHGGFCGVREAIIKNVPIIVCPSQKDQFWVGEQIRKAGIGIELDYEQFTSMNLKEAAKSILSDKTYHNRCYQLREDFITARGMQISAEIIKDLIS